MFLVSLILSYSVFGGFSSTESFLFSSGLVVGNAEVEGLSHITTVILGTNDSISKLVQQLYKLVDMLEPNPGNICVYIFCSLPIGFLSNESMCNGWERLNPKPTPTSDADVNRVCGSDKSTALHCDAVGGAVNVTEKGCSFKVEC
ncbi:hypothetical protein V6N13_109287 [Hibiscus sabdariffa]